MYYAKDMVHKALHTSQSIGGTKGHYFGSVKFSYSFKGKYIFRDLWVPDILVAIAEVHGDESNLVLGSFNDGIDVW